MSNPAPRKQLRVLMLATAFPRPTNMVYSPGIKKMADAIIAYGVPTEVVSFTSWVPRWMAWLPKAKSFADCPPEATWGQLHATYPRWLFYEIGPMRRQAYKSPWLQNHFAWLQAKGRLIRQIKRDKPDVIFATGTLPNGYLAYQLKRKLGIPYVVADFDFGEIEVCNTLPRRRRMYQKIMGNASAMVAVSRRMEESVKKLFPGANAITVFNGIAPLPEKLWTVPRSDDIKGKKVVFCAANFYDRKDLPSLVRAFAKIAPKHPSAVLRIAGDGRDRPNVDRAIAETGIGSRVQMLGIVSWDRLAQEMVWCDFFALTGWDEPFATTYVEAIAAGKPLICCSDGGIADVVVNNEHGYLVPPRNPDAVADALDRMLGNDAERWRMAGNAKRLFGTTLNQRAYARHLTDLFLQASGLARDQVSLVE